MQRVKTQSHIRGLPTQTQITERLNEGEMLLNFFADALKLQGYPSLAFFESDGTLIQSIVGYQTPQELELFLKMIATDKYKEVTTRAQWDMYQKNFKGTFKSR